MHRRYCVLAAAAVLAAAGAAMAATPITSDCEVCPILVPIPAGTYLRGSTPAETEAEGVRAHHAEVEWPQHAVTIDQPFLLGRYEVTVAEYRAFAEATGRDETECLVYRDAAYRPEPGSGWRAPLLEQADDHPVVCVSWEDAVAYADWLSAITGHAYRLPSEAEWEYAARAGTTGARYWRPENGGPCVQANVADRDSERPQFDCVDPYPGTAPVSYGVPNDFGLYGMLGNVGELVADCGLPDYATASGSAAAVTDGDCSRHVGRGGSWWNDAYYLRAARRYSFAGAYRIVGFRVLRELPAQAAAGDQ